MATPIGNLADLSDRARFILASRSIWSPARTPAPPAHAARAGFGRTREVVFAYHEHNEIEAAELPGRSLLEAGASIALVSDAGTPAINADPGFRLVRACRRRGSARRCRCPGPSAVIISPPSAPPGCPATAFSLRRLPRRRRRSARRIAFLFRGPPASSPTLWRPVRKRPSHRGGRRRDPHRAENFGAGRVICVAKEITKLHETFLVGSAEAVQKRLAKTSLKGEFVLLIAPADFVL